MTDDGDRPTPVSPSNDYTQNEPESRRSADVTAARQYASAVGLMLDDKLGPVKSGLANLTDAFNAHTAEEARQRKALLGALAVRSAMPTAALIAALAALVISAFGWAQPAQATKPACPQAIHDAGAEQ